MAGFLSAKSHAIIPTNADFTDNSIRMLKIEPQLAARHTGIALSPLGMLLPTWPRYREPK